MSFDLFCSDYINSFLRITAIRLNHTHAIFKILWSKVLRVLKSKHRIENVSIIFLNVTYILMLF